MTSHVLKEDPYGPTLINDAGDVGPEMALVVGTLPLSCGAERLAGVSGEDGVDRPSERPSVKRREVVPDRGGGEVSSTLSSDDGLPRVVLPLDEAARMKTGFGEHEAKIKATGSSAEGEAVSGT